MISGTASVRAFVPPHFVNIDSIVQLPHDIREPLLRLVEQIL